LALRTLTKLAAATRVGTRADTISSANRCIVRWNAKADGELTLITCETGGTGANVGRCAAAVTAADSRIVCWDTKACIDRRSLTLITRESCIADASVGRRAVTVTRAHTRVIGRNVEANRELTLSALKTCVTSTNVGTCATAMS
jgi:hypothetical protein